MPLPYRFNRLELAGSLGDLGTLLPLAIGMVLINGLNPLGLFFSVGLYYILSGIYFGVTVPIQPMKVIGAYAVATAMNPSQIQASGLLMTFILFVLGVTGAITFLGKAIPKPVVRGIQLSTGAILMSGGVKLIMGSAKFQALRQAAEPYLIPQALGPIPIGIIIGVLGGIMTMLLLDNRRFPAGLFVVLGGIVIGLIFGAHTGLGKLSLNLNLPKILPFGFPPVADFTFAFFALVLPQTPMTLGNAVIAYADLSRDYFGEDSKKVTYKGVCISMAFANFLSSFLGGMPLCHGAGGLAAHYRFGARSAGSNVIIGVIFILLSVLLGGHMLSILYLLPMSVLGVLLLFAGSQLAMTIMDLKERKDLFIALLILGIALASNLAAGFIAGIIVAYLLKWDKLNI